MSIVIITIPGEAKRTFANSLHSLTGGKVDLVIIQKRKSNHNSIFGRLGRLYKAVGLWNLPKEILYAILLRVNGERKFLEYFRERDETVFYDSTEYEYKPKILEVYSINSDEVLDTLQELSPDLMVIWGSTIIKPDILKTAKRAINLHMGLCPHYRGAIANQFAVIDKEPNKIGATIHYAADKVDSGEILETIGVDTTKPPRDLFRDLNNRAEKRYLEIAHKLSQNEQIESRPQDAFVGKTPLLKNWTPSTRYSLARQLMRWEKTGSLD